MKKLPLIVPEPPRLSMMGDGLRRIEASGCFSNNGPEVRAFEAEANAELFGGHGCSLAVANATLGLMIAIREAAGFSRVGGYALMPALTFAATAQAAEWAGLTPLICDIDPHDWSAAEAAEEALLIRHAGDVRVIVPYATFGNAIDLERYENFSRRFNVGVVIDAASSLGTQDEQGDGFGAASRFAAVFSMHATKAFAVAEGGLIHSSDAALIKRLRAMANFGFESGRSAIFPGLNAKLPEVLALMARARLANLDAVCLHRSMLEARYRSMLSSCELQKVRGRRRAMQFMPALLPDIVAACRPDIIAAMDAEGVGAGCYFSPHLGEQPWLRSHAVVDRTPVADQVAVRILSLPLTDRMTIDDVDRVVETVTDAIRKVVRKPAVAKKAGDVARLVIVGGGPAGTAILTAASRCGLLPTLAEDMIIVEQGNAIGGGRLGDYAIASDSSAQTFMSAVTDNPHPEIAALAKEQVGRNVAHHGASMGVPLTKVAGLLHETGNRLAGIVRANGGQVLSGHQALDVRRDGTFWRLRLCGPDGREHDQLAHSVVIATGGHQPMPSLVATKVAGVSLGALAGERLIGSDDVLHHGGLERVLKLLEKKRAPRIAVIGGSTSALAVCSMLLKASLPLGSGSITLLHRRPLRVFYPSVEAAQAEGFEDFDDKDVCPVSGFVFRLAGFRLEARELVQRMLAIDHRVPDPRLGLHRITSGGDRTAQHVVKDADLVIAATGYQPRALKIKETDGRGMTLAVDRGGPLVDRYCRVIDEADQPIPGLFGIGLAAGFVPWGKMGGEPNFHGQANGLWLWQNDVGMMIVDQVMKERLRAVA